MCGRIEALVVGWAIMCLWACGVTTEAALGGVYVHEYDFSSYEAVKQECYSCTRLLPANVYYTEGPGVVQYVPGGSLSFYSDVYGPAVISYKAIPDWASASGGIVEFDYIQRAGACSRNLKRLACTERTPIARGRC